MRAFVIFLVTFLALASMTLAQEVTTTPEGAQIGTVTAGTTPDSFIWGLDVAIDNLRQLLTFDTSTKAKVGLETARERLLEVREMVIENKVNAAQKAQNEHVKTLEKVKTSVTALSRDNSTQELTETLEIEKEIEEHEEEVETVSEELKIKIEVKGGVTAEQQALIDSVLTLMQNKTGEVKIKIENKKDETKIKIKVETGKTDEEIEDEVEKLEEKTGLLDIKQAKAQEQIDDALEELAEVQALLLQVNETQVNVTAVKVLISQAEDHLARSQEAFNETKLGEAFGLATSAERLAKNAEKILERLSEAEEEEEEREVEVEVERGVAKIKVEIDDLKLKYKLNTTNKDEIVNDISIKTGLSVEEINSILEFEIETEEEEETKLEAEIEEGVAKIETKVGDRKTKFVLPTGNRSEIVSEIAKRTGLNQIEVEKILKIEIEEEETEESEKKGESKESESGKSEEKSSSKEESKSSSSSGSSGTSGSSSSGESEKSGKSKED